MVWVYFLCCEHICIPGHSFFEANLRKTKVKNLSLATFRDENVGGFDVAMDDALGVCNREPFRHLDSHTQNRIGIQGPATDTMLQRHSIQKLHHNECLPVRLTDVVNRADVGMVQSRGRLRLPLETRQSLCIACDTIR